MIDGSTETFLKKHVSIDIARHPYVIHISLDSLVKSDWPLRNLEIGPLRVKVAEQLGRDWVDLANEVGCEGFIRYVGLKVNNNPAIWGADGVVGITGQCCLEMTIWG